MCLLVLFFLKVRCVFCNKQITELVKCMESLPFGKVKTRLLFSNTPIHLGQISHYTVTSQCVRRKWPLTSKILQIRIKIKVLTKIPHCILGLMCSQNFRSQLLIKANCQWLWFEFVSYLHVSYQFFLESECIFVQGLKKGPQSFKSSWGIVFTKMAGQTTGSSAKGVK